MLLGLTENGTASYLHVVDEGRLHSARCRERSQQLCIKLDLLQDSSQNLLTILAYC